MLRRSAAACVLALSASLAIAQPGPTLLTVFPPGAKSGESVEVTVSGTGLDGAESLLFSDKNVKGELVPGSFVAEAKTKKRGGSMAAQQPGSAKFKVTAPKSYSGTFDVRIVGKNGLSNPRAFVIGDKNEVNEKEPNNDVAEAQHVALETTVNGIIAAPTDVDFVSFRARAGENIVVYCLATSIDSQMQADLMVADSAGRMLAANRGYRGGDAVLDFLAPADGEYVVRVAQFAYTSGGSDHFYRLTVTAGPWLESIYPPVMHENDSIFYVRSDGKNGKRDPRFTRPDGRPYEAGKGPLLDQVDVRTDELPTQQFVPPAAGTLDTVDMGSLQAHHILRSAAPVILDNDRNDTAATAQPVTLPCDIAGRIEKKNDRDWYSFEAKKGEVWTVEVFADRLGSPVDAFFVLTDDKGKVITEQDEGPDPLSPTQFYSKSDDPARYRFSLRDDGTYRVMVSTREAGTQFGVRDQYVLRIAKENPDFRLAVMPVGTHYPDAGTLPKGGAVMFTVFAFRMDGFAEPITLEASDLPPGVECPKQMIPGNQTSGTLVLTAAEDAADWAGFIAIRGSAGEVSHAARPFSVVWPIVGGNPNQPPNSPAISRMDRGPGLALAVRGEPPFQLAIEADEPIRAESGGKVQFTVKATRKTGFKDPIQLFTATPGLTPQRRGNQPLPAAGTLAADKTEAKVNIDIPSSLPPGTYSLVIRGQSGVPQPKNQQAVPVPSYPAAPITIEIEGKKPAPKKKR